MGEYVKYLGEPIKIGTCENLYYATFGKYSEALKYGALTKEEGNLFPESYVKPDSGYRFRFPFPDEDELLLPLLIDVGDYQRGLPVTIERGEVFQDRDFPALSATYAVSSLAQNGVMNLMPQVNPNNLTEMVTIEIVQQKLITHPDGLRLSLCYRCPFSKEVWRLEETAEGEFVAAQIRLHYAEPATDEQAKDFWNKVAERITEGYHFSDTND
jgi:hypothetical protein